MRLTVKQLQRDTEEQIFAMSIRLQRSERNYDELYDRIDRSLINNENFRKEMTVEFGIMRGEINDMRRELSTEIINLTKAITSALTRIEQRLDALESRS